MKKLIPMFVSFLPLGAFAAEGIIGMIETVKGIVSAVIPLFMILATAFFLWGIIGYIMAAGEEDAIKEARRHVIYGLIGLFVMVSVWGLVKVIADTFGVGSGGIPTEIGGLP